MAKLSTRLERKNPLKNMNRFYTICIVPSVFGGWSMQREWGRVGSPGTVESDPFDSITEAQEALAHFETHKINAGYCLYDCETTKQAQNLPFIKMKLFRESGRGGPTYALLDIRRTKPKDITVTLDFIKRYEPISIRAIKSVDLTADEGDIIKGIRVKLSDNSVRIILDDCNPCFEDTIAMAIKNGIGIHGNSEYVRRLR